LAELSSFYAYIRDIFPFLAALILPAAIRRFLHAKKAGKTGNPVFRLIVLCSDDEASYESKSP
jgi:hypothetical protein